MKTIKKELNNITIPTIISNRDLVIFDIETTGFSREFHQVILIGAIEVKAGKISFTQWFNDDGKSEKQILQAWNNLVAENEKALYLTYNGDAFDVPFINARMDSHNLKTKMHKSTCLDVYRAVRRRYKELNGVEDYKLKSIEKYLGIHREDTISGKESIDLYHDYLASKSEELEAKILLHNDEDIRLMLPLLRILDIIDISMDLPIEFNAYGYQYKVKYHSLKKGFLQFKGELMDQLPIQIIKGKLSILTVDHSVEVRIPIIEHDGYLIADTVSIFNQSFNHLTPTEKQSMILGFNESLLLENIKQIVTMMIESR